MNSLPALQVTSVWAVSQYLAYVRRPPDTRTHAPNAMLLTGCLLQ